MIQRWDFDDCPVSARDGYYVLYVEHLEVLEAALAAEKEKVRELVEALKSSFSFVVVWADRYSREYELGGEFHPTHQKLVDDIKALIEKYSKEEPNNE